MNISDYFIEEGQAVYFEEQQASTFAKSVAGDFNPIHDPGTKRFCVPGDLLFSVLLSRYGVSATTTVEFSGMLDGGTRMQLPEQPSGSLDIIDANGRALMSIHRDGVEYTNAIFISALCHEYVKFSGQTFPGILVPLMEGAAVMINPARPLVIYKDMTIKFNDKANSLFEGGGAVQSGELLKPIEDLLTLRSSGNDIEVDGRKGKVRLSFSIDVDGVEIGSGEKNMLLSGLREYDQAAMMAIVEQYNAWRRDYKES